MKKIVLIILCMLAMASIIRSIEASPSTLEIRVTLVEGGIDMTAQLRRYVGYAPDGTAGPPTLGNIRVLMPTEEDGSVYEVPPNRRIAIFVLSPGVPYFQSTARVEPRQHLMHEVVLNAGIVRVTTNNEISNIWFLDPYRQFDGNDRFFDGTQFLVPAGEQTFQVGRYSSAMRETVDVIAGQTHHLHIQHD